MAPSHLTLRDLERSKSRSLRFESVISRKGGNLGHMSLLNFINKETIFIYGESNGNGTFHLVTLKLNVKDAQILKPYKARSDLTLRTLEGSKSRLQIEW